MSMNAASIEQMVREQIDRRLDAIFCVGATPKQVLSVTDVGFEKPARPSKRKTSARAPRVARAPRLAAKPAKAARTKVSAPIAAPPAPTDVRIIDRVFSAITQGASTAPDIAKSAGLDVNQVRGPIRQLAKESKIRAVARGTFQAATA